MTQQTDVERAMGQVSLAFIWISTDRMGLRYANDDSPMLYAKAKWRKPWLLKQMGPGLQHFCVLTAHKPSPSSPSGSTYEILGVLCRFDCLKELQEANHMYWNHVKGTDNSFEKLARTIEVALSLKQWLESNGCESYWNEGTYSLLEMAGEGRLKEVKEIVKGYV